MVSGDGATVTILTGAGSGIGRATALRLARRGDRIAICDLDEKGLRESAQQIEACGGLAEIAVIDVRDRRGIESWCAEVIGKFGRVDYLFSNAGVNARGPVSGMPLADWTLLLDTHVTGTFHFCQTVLRHMVERKAGAIVITSSDFAIVGTRYGANYAAAKTALYSLTKALALEFAPCGIRVNAIGPGPIDTPLLRVRRSPTEWEEARREFESRLPMKRLGKPEEVASVVDFLLSDRAAYITGQLLHPNGGQVMW